MNSINIRVESLTIGTIGSLLASFILYLADKITLSTFFTLFLILELIFFIYQYYRIKNAIKFRNIWIPTSRKPLNYKLEEAKSSYLVMGVTLSSMLQTTGIGIDIESFARHMPKGLKIRLLILNPGSPYFLERIMSAHPNFVDKDELLSLKLNQLNILISTILNHLHDNVEIRFYNTYPAWWIQIIDQEKVYFSTQTIKSHIGQTYTFGMLFHKNDDSEMCLTILEMIESLWRHSVPINSDGTIPKLDNETETKTSFSIEGSRDVKPKPQ